jgi:hypothetical protein
MDTMLVAGGVRGAAELVIAGNDSNEVMARLERLSLALLDA